MVAGLRQKLLDTELTLRNVYAGQENVLNELYALKDLERQGRHLRRFASDEEIQAWERKVEAAGKKVTAANEEAVVALQERNAAAEACRPAEEKLSSVAAEEFRIRKALSGESYVDPEY